eukprot:10455994-Heterocapsa_arctica.AAC.1
MVLRTSGLPAFLHIASEILGIFLTPDANLLDRLKLGFASRILGISLTPNAIPLDRLKLGFM